jgi:hypothetical protein
METKEAIAAINEISLNRLQAEVFPGSTIYSICRHVSASKITRSYAFLIIKDGELWEITYMIARAIGYHVNDAHGGIETRGYGKEGAHHLVMDVARKLFNDACALHHRDI